MCGIASGCKCFFKKPKLCICGTAFLLYTDKNLKDIEHWIHSHKFWVLVLIRCRSRGGEMGEFSPPPPFFSEPSAFFFLLSLKYWLDLLHYHKKSPSFQNPGSMPAEPHPLTRLWHSVHSIQAWTVFVTHNSLI